MKENMNDTDIMMENGAVTMAMMKDAISFRIGGCTVEAQEAKKNNGIIRHGLRIQKQGSNIAPCIYLDEAFKAYQGGKSLSEIVTMVVENYQENRISDFDTTIISDFEKAKERLCFKVINSELNRELLCDVPHVPFCDLSVVFYLLIDNSGSVMVTNMLMADWGVDTETLLEIAKRNTPLLLHGSIVPMKNIIEDILDDRAEDLLPDEDDGMYVATNIMKSNGAAVFLYDSMLSGLADSISRDFYIIPSLVHELIFLPDDLKLDPEEIKSIILNVNFKCVAPEEVLSNNLYHYQRKTGLVELVA